VSRASKDTVSRKSWCGRALGLVLACFGIGASAPVAAGSPYQLSWGTDGLVGGLGLGVAATGHLLDSSVTPLTPEQVARLDCGGINALDATTCDNWSPAVATLSDVLVGTLIASPLLLALGEEVRADAVTYGVMYAETLVWAVFAPQIFKGTVQRTRPFVYGDEAPLEEQTAPDARRSFLSGHTTAAFASAVFFASVYGANHPDGASRGWVWGGALAAATTVGLFRYEAGKHFPTDILAGAALGSLIGWGVPFFHRAGREADGPQGSLGIGREGVMIAFGGAF